MTVFANPASCQYCSANLLLAPSGRGEKQCWPGDGMMASDRLFVLPAVSVLNRLVGGEPRDTRCPSDTSSRVSLAQLGPVLIRSGRRCILWLKVRPSDEGVAHSLGAAGEPLPGLFAK
jgi:hypothetical protein